MGRLYLCVLLSFLGAIVSSGQIRMRVIMRNPAPAQLSVWQTDPSVAQAEISNLGYPIDAVRLTGGGFAQAMDESLHRLTTMIGRFLGFLFSAREK